MANQRRAEVRRQTKAKNKARRHDQPGTYNRKYRPPHAARYTCIPWELPMKHSTSAPQSPRIAVLTIATGPYRDIYSDKQPSAEEQAAFEAARNASLADRQQYCERHGYACHVFTDAVKGRAAGWYRLPAVLTLLGRGDFDWIFHLDLDAVIHDHSVRLEEFLDPRYDLIIGVDRNGINNGVFFIRNSTWSRLLYAEAWTRTHEKNSIYWAEQAALAGILRDNIGAQNHLKVMPHAFFNTYLPEGEIQPAIESTGAFIIHFAGRADKWKLVQESLLWKREEKEEGGAAVARLEINEQSEEEGRGKQLLPPSRLPPADDDAVHLTR